jgi:putative transposase
MKRKVEKQHRRSIRLKGYDYANSGAYFVTIVTQGRACLFGEIVNAETRLNDAGSVIERWWFELNNKFRKVETDDFAIMPNHFHGIVVIADAVGADLCVGPLTDLRVSPDSEGAHAGAPLQGVTQQRPPQPMTRMGTGVNPDVHPAHQGTHAGVPLQGTHPVRPVARRGRPEHVLSTVEGCAPVLAPQNASQRTPLPTIVQWFKTMTTNEYLRGVKTSGWAPFQGQLWQRNYYEHVIRDNESLNRIREYILNNPAQWAFDPENPATTAAEPPDIWRLQARREGRGDRPVAPTKDVRNT